MKLKRLAGFGPIAAFVSAATLLVAGILGQTLPPPSWVVPTVLTVLTSFVLWMASLTITLFDLEWLEHPATSTPVVRAALVATFVAMVMPVVIGVIAFGFIPVNLAYPWAILLGGVGASMLIHNLEGRRAHLLHGALPWIGIVAGACFICLAILQLTSLFTLKLVMGLFYGFPVTQLLYIVWAIWMGVHLVRSRSHAPVRGAAVASAAN